MHSCHKPNSESSLFVFPHKLILKTCGTTLNLLGVTRILEIAAQYANMFTVYRCFYSRKSFMFPERQKGPHRDWKQEVEFLDGIFKDGAAYTIGKVNGDHWLLYMASQTGSITGSPPSSQVLPPSVPQIPDYTIEILMSDLHKSSQNSFFFSEELASKSPSTLALDTSHELGINDIFPSHLTSLDAYAFTPCGYSSNALIKREDESSPESPHSPLSHHPGEGYFTIHVTPEEGWSYASFECNVPLAPSCGGGNDPRTMPDITTLVRRVVSIFQPGRITLTLFISSKDDEDESDSTTEKAQKAFRAALTPARPGQKIAGDDEWSCSYRRTDKINYAFGDYDLAFASFELTS